MATAQQLFVDHFVQEINANPNLNTVVVASSPSPGTLRVTVKSAGQHPHARYIQLPGSRLPHAEFKSEHVTGSPEYQDLRFSWSLAPGDRVKINVGVQGGVSSDLEWAMPLGTTVDPGGFNWSAVGGGGVGGGAIGTTMGGTGTNTARDRRLVVMECGLGSTSMGSLFAIDPNNATGIALPTFRVGANAPAVGSTLGQAFYDQGRSQGLVWDGVAWRDIAPNPVQSYTTEAQLLADATPLAGTFGVAQDTGMLFLKTATGWRPSGVTRYPSYAGMLADTANRTSGDLGLIEDESLLFVHTLNGWRCNGVREFADTTAMDGWTQALPGDQAEILDQNLLFIRTAVNTWKPISIWEDTEANIRAAAGWPKVGQEAIATDSGRIFVYTAAGWVEEPIQHYATEALLLAATPANGTLAWADDTNWAFTRSGGNWNRLGGPAMTAGPTDPQAGGTPTADGDLWADTGAGVLKVWIGGATGSWTNLSTTPITVGGTAPATPAVGDMFYDNTNAAGKRLGVRFWDGTDWRGVHGSQFGANFPGAEVVIPLYGNHLTDLANTHTPVAVVGLMAEATSDHPTLWMKYNDTTFYRLLPQMGVAANAGKILEANADGIPQWATPAAQIHIDEKHETGVQSSYLDFTANPPTKYFHATGSVQPLGGTGPYTPRLFAYHDAAWVDFSSAQMCFEGATQVWWPNTVAADETLKTGADLNGIKLIPPGAKYEPGQYATMTYELFVTGFGLQGTNDRVMITVRSGPYKNPDGVFLSFNTQFRMGPGFNPADLHAIGMKLPAGCNGAFSMQATWK